MSIKAGEAINIVRDYVHLTPVLLSKSVAPLFARCKVKSLKQRREQQPIFSSFLFPVADYLTVYKCIQLCK